MKSAHVFAVLALAIVLLDLLGIPVSDWIEALFDQLASIHDFDAGQCQRVLLFDAWGRRIFPVWQVTAETYPRFRHHGAESDRSLQYPAG